MTVLSLHQNATVLPQCNIIISSCSYLSNLALYFDGVTAPFLGRFPSSSTCIPAIFLFHDFWFNMSIVCWGPKAYQRISEMKSGGFVRPQRNRPWSRQHCWRGLLSRCISKHEWVDHVQLKTSVSSCHLIYICLLLFLPFFSPLLYTPSCFPPLLSLSLSPYTHITVYYCRLLSSIPSTWRKKGVNSY